MGFKLDPAELNQHPELQPLRGLTTDEYERLKERISSHGFHEDQPLLIDEENNVIDGNHRLEIVLELRDEGEPIEEVPVQRATGVASMSMDEKQELAWKRNLDETGRDLTDQEKKKHVKHYLREFGFQNRTETEVANDLGVSQPTVNRAKRELEEAGESIQGNKFVTREAKREAIREYRQNHPEASDADVAEELGVDRKTVAGVRQEMEMREEVSWGEEMAGEKIFPYIGSKYNIARWLVSKFPAHETYVEPFGGSAAVLFTKPREGTEVYNDIDGDFAHFFETLKENPGGIERVLEDVDFTREQHEQWTKHWYEGWRPELEPQHEDQPGADARRAAVFFFARYSQYKNKYREYAGFFHPRSNPDNADEFQTHKNKLTQFSKRFQNVRIENRDYTDVLEEYDGSNTLFYLDPPYVNKEEYYGEFSHERLVEAVNGLRADFILSYGERIPDGLDQHRQIKMANMPGNRANVERHILNFSKEAEGTYRNALNQNW